MRETERGLRSVDFKRRYRSPQYDVVADFFVPAFRAATSYSRAVGYFTSTSLALYARGIHAFTARDGLMRLVASPHLNEDDISDIERGYDIREVAERAAMRTLDSAEREVILDGLGVLGRLIAQRRLDIKLAFVEKEGHVGIYHEKIGVFRDDRDDLVAFTGSSNETLGGLQANFESIDVFRGWETGDGARALDIESDFERLWADQTPNLRVIDFPEVAHERLVQISRERPLSVVAGADDALLPPPTTVDSPTQLSVPSSLRPRDYQKRAIEAWLRNRGRGLLKMATGTGKTKTAMIAATQLGNALREQEQPLILLILAPQLHLVDQWLSEVAAFGVRAIPVYEKSQNWIPIVEEQLAAARLGQRPVVAMIATYASFSGSKFQSILARIHQPLLVIADEAHNLGSGAYRSLLPANATYRLALSATPERWFDDEGTDALLTYFDEIVFELSMGEAIEMGALTRYLYYPRLVELNTDEAELYVDLTAQIASRIAAGEDPGDADPDSPLGFLLLQRSKVLGHAAGKLAALQADLDANRDTWYQLVYCGEGNRPSAPGEPEGPNQLKEVMRMVGNDLHMAGHSYVSKTPRAERRVLLRRFGSGDDLQVLVAMRCLDEGVDIPDARAGYLLASSSNPRQFIQRRGRLLRRSQGKQSATIYDYLAVPPEGSPINFTVERSLLVRELQRANEFGKLSENYAETLRVLRPLKERYQLMDL